MMRAASLLVALVVASSSLVLAQVPVTLGFKGEDLAASREKYQAGDTDTVKRVKKVLATADEAMKLGPMSVMDKEFTPPTGDKHDYMSLSPYWWPDPNKSDGLPYVRRDGEVNPERAKYDENKFSALTQGVFDLAMGYSFSGHKKYAKHASELINQWYIAPSTRMNPNCRFAQFVPGYPKTRASGVIEARKTVQVLDAIEMIRDSGEWSSDQDAAMKKWVGEMLEYLLTSEQGTAEAKSPNNHGTFYGVQVASYALWLGDKDKAKELLVRFVRDRVATQFEEDGKQPYELERTKGFDYCRFNLLAHQDGALLGERVGLDLWNYKSENGRSIRQGLDWLLPYAAGQKKWEHQQITPTKFKEAATVYRRAANAYNEPKYEAAIGKMGTEGAGDVSELIFPKRK